jgi:autotransporter-associated beta strand protein
VTSLSGPIQLRADRDVLGNADGTVTSQGGNVEITANNDHTNLGPNNDGTIDWAGNITAGAGTVTLSLGDCDGYLYGSIVSALEVTKNGAGALRLQGGHNTYTGTTTINDGTLLVNSAIVGIGGAVTVTGTPSATLGGNGTINRPVNVHSGGTLDPGDCDPSGSTSTCSPQPGQLTVNGNVVFQPGATFRVQLDGIFPAVTAPRTGKYDQLAVNGTVHLGGDPLGANGATLVTSVGMGFSLPVGAAFRVIDNDLADTIDTQFNGLAEDAFLLAGGYVTNISYQSGSNSNDVTLTHPGRYDFNANPPNNEAWYEAVNTSPYYGPLYAPPTVTSGWNSRVMAVGRGGSEGSSLPRDAYTPVRLLSDLAFTGSSATWLVDALSQDTITGTPLQYQILITSGDYAWPHDASVFKVGDTTTAVQTTGTATTPQGEFAQLLLRPVTVASLLGSLVGRMQIEMSYDAIATGKIGWTAVLNGLDIRPITTVGLITITRDDALLLGTPVPPNPAATIGVPVSADGLTIDHYTGTHAVPNSLITVTTTNGTIVTTDVDRYLQGVQVRSDASGTFHFDIRRPSGTGVNGTATGTATIKAWEIGGRSYGEVGQVYNQLYPADPTLAAPITWRRYDFNSSYSPTADGYIGVLPNSVYSPQTGFGWITSETLVAPVRGIDVIQSSDYLRRDFHLAQTATFWVQVTPGQTYTLRALFGQAMDGVLNGSNQLGDSGRFFGEGSAYDALNPGVNPTTITITTAEDSLTSSASVPKPWLRTGESISVGDFVVLW